LNDVDGDDEMDQDQDRCPATCPCGWWEYGGLAVGQLLAEHREGHTLAAQTVCADRSRRRMMLLKLAFPGAQSIPIHASTSMTVLGFAFGLSLLTGVLFGVAPAWIAAQVRPVDALRSGARTTAAGASRLQRALVVLQAALSLVLLVGAGLFFAKLEQAPAF